MRLSINIGIKYPSRWRRERRLSRVQRWLQNPRSRNRPPPLPRRPRRGLNRAKRSYRPPWAACLINCRKKPAPATHPAPTEEDQVTLATVAPEHEMQTDSALPTVEGQPAEHVGLRPVEGDYRLVNTREKLEEMLSTLRRQLAEVHGRPAWLAVDTETDALGSMASNLCGISLSAKEGTGYYVAVKGAVEEVLDETLVRDRLGPVLADPAIKKLGQNLKYDINSLRNFGLQLNGVDFDTMVASYVVDSSRLSHGMDALAADYLGLRPIPISDLIGKASSQISFADVPLQRAAHYSAEDADVTLRLAVILQPKLAALGAETEKLFRDVEMPLVQTLADMEYHGVMIDTRLLKGLSTEIEKKLHDLQGRIRTAAGIDFNQDSPRQLADVLFKPTQAAGRSRKPRTSFLARTSPCWRAGRPASGARL